MITYMVVAVVWAVAYIAIAQHFLTRGRAVLGGFVMFAVALVPTIYGRSTTSSEWHDSPMMGIYYLPTMLAVLISLTVVVVGVFRLANRWLSARMERR